MGFMTGGGQNRQLAHFLAQRGQARWLAKPFSAEELQAFVAWLVAGSQVPCGGPSE